MARYFFDVDDGTGMAMDGVGLDCPSLVQVRAEAMKALPDIAREVISDGETRVIKTIVRDASDRKVFEASLALDAKWL